MNTKKLKQIGLSHSRRIAFLSCKKRFWYILNNWYNPMSSIFKNTLFGNLCHFILEHIQIFKNRSDFTIEKLLKICDLYIKNNPKGMDTIDLQELMHEKCLAAVTIHCYLILWFSNDKNNLSDISKNFKVLKSELYLKKLKINEDVFNLKIDKVLIDKKNNIWILDHKCKSRFNIDILRKKLIIDEQSQLYRLGFEKAYKKKVYGIIQDIIRKPQLRMTKKDGSMSIFMQRVKNDILSRSEYYFNPIVLPLEDVFNKNFESDLKIVMEDIYKCLDIGEKAFIKNTESCDSPFTCDFIDACVNNNMNLYLKNF